MKEIQFPNKYLIQQLICAWDDFLRHEHNIPYIKSLYATYIVLIWYSMDFQQKEDCCLFSRHSNSNNNENPFTRAILFYSYSTLSPLHIVKIHFYHIIIQIFMSFFSDLLIVCEIRFLTQGKNKNPKSFLNYLILFW